MLINTRRNFFLSSIGLGVGMVSSNSINAHDPEMRIDNDSIHTSKSILEFGAVHDWNGVSGTDNTAAFSRARDWAANAKTPVELTFPSGRYLISSSPDWGISKLKLTSIGTVEFKCNGAGPVIDLNGNASEWIYDVVIGNFVLTGSSETTHVFLARKIAHCNIGRLQVREGRQNGFNIELAVACVFNTPSCSVNEQPMRSIPETGFRLAAFKGLLSTANTLINPIMEGTEIGIDCSGADFNTFIGGTTEACARYGVVIGPVSNGNQVINLACEANGEADILDRGDGSIIQGGYSSKLIKCESAKQPTIRNVHAQTIIIDEKTSGATVEDVKISSFSKGGEFFNLGSELSMRSVYDVSLARYVVGRAIGRNPTSDFVQIRVSSSPFTYLNPSQSFQMQALIKGGAVSKIELVRSSIKVTVGGESGMPSSGLFPLAPGDGIVIHYTEPPEFIKLPY